MNIVFFVFQLYVVAGILGVVSKNQNKCAVRLIFLLFFFFVFHMLYGLQLAKVKKYIPYMPLP